MPQFLEVGRNLPEIPGLKALKKPLMEGLFKLALGEAKPASSKD